MPQIIGDEMAYIVFCQDGRFGQYVRERDKADVTRAETVRDVMTGQFDGQLQILEINPVEGTCRDVTDDILAEADALAEREAA